MMPKLLHPSLTRGVIIHMSMSKAASNNFPFYPLGDLKANSGSTEEQLSDAEEKIESLMKMKFEYEEKMKELEETIEEREVRSHFLNV